MTEEQDLWLAYCLFHVGDYKRSMEVKGALYKAKIDCVTIRLLTAVSSMI